MSYIDRRFFDLNLTISGIANEPAVNPTAGTQYIVGSTPAGDFANASANSLARYNGTAWKFITPKAGALEVLNTSTGEILKFDGTNWVAVASLGDKNISPVLDVVATGTTLPATAEAGDKFLNTSDGKLYTATAENTWDSGVALSSGDRYASSTDQKIYTSDGTTLTAETIPDGAIFLNKATNSICANDAEASNLQPTTGGGASGTEIITESHTLTAEEITAKGFSLSNSIATGSESSVILFIQGIAQVAGTDFTASGTSISWTDKTLENVGLLDGDVFVVQYQKA